MPAVQFSCPGCDAVLTSKTRPKDGARVRCPHCGEPFTFGADPEDREPGRAGGRATRRGAGQRPARRREDSEDYGDDDDRGRRPGAGKGLVIGLALGALALLLVVGGGVFLAVRGKPGGSGGGPGGGGGAEADEPRAVNYTDFRDALAHVPPDSALVGGMDVASVRDLPLPNPLLEDWCERFGVFACRPGTVTPLLKALEKTTGRPFKEWCDYVLFAGRVSNVLQVPTDLLVFKSNVDITPEKLGQAFPGLRPKTVQGRACYAAPQGELATLYLPGPRLLVAARFDPFRLGGVQGVAGSGPASAADLQAVIGAVGKSSFWSAGGLDFFQKAGMDFFGNAPMIAQESRDRMNRLRQAKARGVGVTVGKRGLVARCVMLAPDAATARLLVQDSQAEKDMGGLMRADLGAIPTGRNTGAASQQWAGETMRVVPTCTAQGQMVIETFQLSRPAWEAQLAP